MAQCTEHWPANERVTGSIPSQGTCHAGFADQVPSRGHMRGNHTLMFLSLFLSLPFPLSINEERKEGGREGEKKKFNVGVGWCRWYVDTEKSCRQPLKDGIWRPLTQTCSDGQLEPWEPSIPLTIALSGASFSTILHANRQK